MLKLSLEIFLFQQYEETALDPHALTASGNTMGIRAKKFHSINQSYKQE